MSPAAARAEAPPALERALALLDPGARPEEPDTGKGYLDLVGDEGPPSTGMTQDLMLSRVVPQIYERWWRPALGRAIKGALGPGMADEHRIARLLLGLVPGDGVLDVACGPGNFTRDFAKTVGPTGLAVGFDASPTMLARAVRDTEPGTVAYVRGDALNLPFRDASFDAVCCFAALHLFPDPFRGLDEMARVLTPGGRIALFTSCGTRTRATRAVAGAVAASGGMRLFGRDEVTAALKARGFEDVRRRVAGLTQFVGGRRAR